MKKHIITWEEYIRDIGILSNTILMHKNTSKYAFLAAIPRGGCIIAVCLSHSLNIPLIHEIERLEYEENILLIDDVSDSGKQLIEWTEAYPNIIGTATLYRKDKTKFEPDFTVRTINTWIRFPYELS